MAFGVNDADRADGADAVAPNLAAQVARVAAPVREQVLDLLRREIVEMRLLPGQRLVERELIERIGVSRTTIREALRELAAEGLVTTIPQKGAIVAAPSWKEAAEVYEVRALLEGAAAREFAERADDDQVRALREALDAIERSADADDPKSLLAAKDRFYEVLFEGAGNATIRQILESLQARVAVMRAASLQASGRPAQSAVEIRAIVEAIEQRDGAVAAEAASYHVRRAAHACSAQIDATRDGDGAVRR
ncbi:MAG TPA: GntR family transcriptional regulator [Solirubrobacteraceae bacterium]|nr:GntR family transcriptional regulator [Solirubrobacteraceae bacterium]